MRGTHDRKRSPLRPACGAAVAIAAGFLLAGCQMYTEKPAPTPKPPSPEIDDPCAERMHDLCAPFFLYFTARKQLPETLEDLAKASPTPLPPLVCPKCGKPYIYNPEGIELPNGGRRAILYDPEPCHYGFRRAIVVEPIRPAKPLVADVRLVPEHPVFDPPVP